MLRVTYKTLAGKILDKIIAAANNKAKDCDFYCNFIISLSGNRAKVYPFLMCPSMDDFKLLKNIHIELHTSDYNMCVNVPFNEFDYHIFESMIETAQKNMEYTINTFDDMLKVVEKYNEHLSTMYDLKFTCAKHANKIWTMLGEVSIIYYLCNKTFKITYNIPTGITEKKLVALMDEMFEKVMKF